VWVFTAETQGRKEFAQRKCGIYRHETFVESV
jgi:hypothetical protein